MTTTALLPNVPGLAGLPINEQIIEIELGGGGGIAAVNSSNGIALICGAR